MLLDNIDECGRMRYIMALMMFYHNDNDVENIIYMMDYGVVA